MPTCAPNGSRTVLEHLVLDWFIRTHIPAWLRAARLHDASDRPAALPETIDVEPAEAATDAVENTSASVWSTLEEAQGTGGTTTEVVAYRLKLRVVRSS